MPVRKRKFSPVALEHLAESIEHARTFIDRDKQRAAVKAAGLRAAASGGTARARHVRWHIRGGYNPHGNFVPPKPKSWCDFCVEEGLI